MKQVIWANNFSYELFDSKNDFNMSEESENDHNTIWFYVDEIYKCYKEGHKNFLNLFPANVQGARKNIETYLKSIDEVSKEQQKLVENFLEFNYFNKDLCPDDLDLKDFWSSLRSKYPKGDFSLVSFKDGEIRELYREIYEQKE